MREILPEEHGEVADLVESAYLEVLGDRLDAGYLRLLRDVAGRAEQATVLVAHDGERLVGTVTFVAGPGPYAEFSRPDQAGMRMLAVVPGARRRGVGRALVAECVRRTRAAGRTRLLLHTVEAMVDARRLYVALGFGRRPGEDRTVPDDLRLWAYELDLAAPPIVGRRGT